MTELEFVVAVLRNSVNRSVLERLPDLDLNDAWLVSGALFQSVWNVRTGRAPEFGIRDYDIFYFDTDIARASEDTAIKRTRHLLADLDAEIQLRNQARVHLWYEKKFGAPYSPLTCATDGIDRFLMHNAQVCIRRRGAEFEIYAPHGLGDIAEMIVRPNRTANFQATRFLEKANRWKTLWPEITIIPN